MLIKKLLAFHQKTLDQYRQEENLAPWKEKVMRIHRESGFLFYFEEIIEYKEDADRILLAGETVSGKAPEDRGLFFYDGKGVLLGTGSLISDPEEEEEHRRGLRTRKNVCQVRPDSYLDHPWDSLPGTDRKRALNRLALDLSLVTDRSFE